MDWHTLLTTKMISDLVLVASEQWSAPCIGFLQPPTIGERMLLVSALLDLSSKSQMYLDRVSSRELSLT